MAARNRVRHAPPRAAVPHPSQVATATRSAPGDAQRGAAGDFVLLGSGCIGREGSRLVAEEDTWVSAMANAETVCSAAKVMMSTWRSDGRDSRRRAVVVSSAPRHSSSTPRHCGSCIARRGVSSRVLVRHLSAAFVSTFPTDSTPLPVIHATLVSSGPAGSPIALTAVADSRPPGTPPTHTASRDIGSMSPPCARVQRTGVHWLPSFGMAL
mmetsp:Transcript_15768/g.47483  ORF Transcript_15768/g.47483 Transcript_15768/m.47483 type:complete len:211 (-) Transcript_15768:79-711(-)